MSGCSSLAALHEGLDAKQALMARVCHRSALIFFADLDCVAAGEQPGDTPSEAYDLGAVSDAYQLVSGTSWLPAWRERVARVPIGDAAAAVR